MKKLVTLGLVAAVASFTACAKAEDMEAGLKAGDAIGAFNVEKCAGAPEDGVAVGTKLCYRCKLGNRPMVMVFSRSSVPTDKVAAIVTELDKTVAANKDKNLASFVSFIGADAEALKAEAKKVESAAKASNVALVVAKDQPNGPKGYKINEDADVTVIIAKEGKVTASYAVKADGLSKDLIAKVVADAKSLVN
jgi:hypothetical protein